MSKHITCVCATAIQMHMQKQWSSDQCPNCKGATETAQHVVQCTHEDIISIFRKGVRCLKYD
eukprot:14603503-Ditylum_brightwellii.AAC.2